MDWILIGIPAGFLLWSSIIYKSFIYPKHHVLEAWCGIDRQLHPHPQYRIPALVVAGDARV
jgi:hypothetical protein